MKPPLTTNAELPEDAASPENAGGPASLPAGGKPRRIEFLASARGAALLYIVVDHLVQGFREADWYTSPIGRTLFQAYATFDSATTGTRLPFLMFMTGLFLERSLARGTRQFIVARTKSLIWPLLLWGIIQGVVFAALPGLTPWGGKVERDGLASLLAALSSFQIIPAMHAWVEMSKQLWFLNMLSVFLVLYLFIRHFPRPVLFALALMALVSGIVLAALPRQSNPALSVVILLGPFFFFFVLGTLLSDWVVRRNAEITRVQAAVAGCLFLGIALLAVAVGPDRAYGLGFLSALPAIPLLLNAGKWLAKSRVRGVFAWMGEASLLVLCIHMLCIAFVLALAHAAGITSSLPLIAVAGVGGVALCYLFDKALRFLGLSAAFGFGGRPPTRPAGDKRESPAGGPTAGQLSGHS